MLLCDEFVIKGVLIYENTGKYSSKRLTKRDRSFLFFYPLPLHIFLLYT